MLRVFPSFRSLVYRGSLGHTKRNSRKIIRTERASDYSIRARRSVKFESSPTQDGAEIEDGSSVKGAEGAPSRPAVVPCRLYDHRYERRQRREYRTAQGVLETLE